MRTQNILSKPTCVQNMAPYGPSSVLKCVFFGLYSTLLNLVLGVTSCFGETTTTTPSPSTLPQSTHIQVQEVKSHKGITAWIVKSQEIPVVSVALAFRHAGTAAEPRSSIGLAQLLANMIDEGAGNLTSQEFKAFLLKHNIELTVKAEQDIFEINFRTTKKNIHAAFHLLRNMLTKPRFDKETLARVKNQLSVIFEQSLHNEHTLCTQQINHIMYGDHPYGRRIQQVIKDLPKITDTQLHQFMKERFGRDQLLVSIVGDITESEVKDYLDQTFDSLPEKAVPIELKAPTLPTTSSVTVVPIEIPQSFMRFAQPGISRKDPDWYAAFVLLRIIGDGQFESRLWDEVREKRGLAYEIEANLAWSEQSAIVLGGTATKNCNVKEVIKLIQNVWTKTHEGVSQSEVDFVKRRLIGNFALNFSSTAKIARALMSYQVDELGIDYINERNKIINSLKLEDINRVAKTLLKPEQLTFVICGNPKELTSLGLTPNAQEGAIRK